MSQAQLQHHHHLVMAEQWLVRVMWHLLPTSLM